MMASVRLCGRTMFASKHMHVILTKNIWRKNLHLSRLYDLKFNAASSSNEYRYDVVVIGGGIVGVATARELLIQHPTFRMAIVEKEPNLAFHQSGNNSGVIHAGIYYKPGSLKAKLCVEGLHLMYDYLENKKIPYKKAGKLIVATRPAEVPALQELMKRGIANKVPDLKMIEGSEIPRIEPHCKGLKAIHSPHTGIVDYVAVTKSFSEDFKKAGGEIFLNFKVTRFDESSSCKEYPVKIKGESKNINASYVVVCCGLQSDMLAEMGGCSKEPRIIPFRGEYLLLSKQKQHLVKGNIYPVPDPRYPFLGVHFTPRMDGSIWLGPNAILAFKREGYRWRDFDMTELKQSLTYSGFHKLALKYAGYGTSEMMKSIFPVLQIKELQRFIPEIRASDISRGPAGVRAQAMDSNGTLVDDFVFDIGKNNRIGNRILHSRNTPSPGATSSLAIAKVITEKARDVFQLKS